MFKTYQKYIIKNFISKYLVISLVFFALTIILGSLEEISFLKNLDVNYLYPYYLTLLNAPIILFEIFPFILLLTTQFLFYDLHKRDELDLLKVSGLTNLSIIKIILLMSIFIGLFNVTIFYNIAANLKFHYSNMKNNFSNDNKYLAMVTSSGLWIKDEIDGNKFIIKSKFINNNFISETVINEYDENFNLIKIIQSEKVNITDYNWIIENPKITKDNLTYFSNDPIIITTNFNYDKISKIFSNISTLDIFKLFNLKKDYEKLGYSSNEIFLHLLELSTTPLFYGILVLLASILMFNLKKNNSILIHVVVGFLVSIFIYYLTFFFSSLGNAEKIPIVISVIFPLLILTLLCSMGLIKINEK
jgi:lipopolysaccharide export system permease protein